MYRYLYIGYQPQFHSCTVSTGTAVRVRRDTQLSNTQSLKLLAELGLYRHQFAICASHAESDRGRRQGPAQGMHPGIHIQPPAACIV
jgi:hypothetical protein